jgi:predicted DCC family thiol-disulfide oxidoreductase YuxK
MKHGWTGGQYSVWRVALALVVCTRFAPSLASARANATPMIDIVLAGAGVALAIVLALGAWHRTAAIALAALVMFARNPEYAASSDARWLAVALLVSCACTRPAPYLSLPALGRTDPSGSWILPDWLYACGWVVLAAACTHDILPFAERAIWPDGSPRAFELAWRWLGWLAYLVPLAIARERLPIAWLLLCACELWIAFATPSGDLTPVERWLALALAFDPGWIAPRFPRAVETVLYDGHCGLCHRFVRFLLAEDRMGAAFRFAPLDGARAAELSSAEERAKLPDSMAIVAFDGRVLTRSHAARHALSRLGGAWRIAAIASSIVPTFVLDRAYDLVARLRHKLFARPDEACPLIPAHLRRRFEA